MNIGLKKLAEDDKRATPLVMPEGAPPPVYPPAEFKYSELHINVIAHLSKPGRFEQPFRISLRDDAPALDWNKTIDWHDFNREHRQKGWSCAPPGCKSDTGPRALGSHAAACIGRPAFGGLHSTVCPAKIMPRRTSCRAPMGSPPRTISCHLASLPKRTIQDGPARRSVTCRGGRTQIAPRSHLDRPARALPLSIHPSKLQRRST